MGYEIQFEGTIMLGPNPGSLTDYSDDFSEFLIGERRSTVVKAPSYGSPDVEQKASADEALVAAVFAANPGTSGLWAALRAGKKTRTGELYFEVRYGAGAVSVDNPKFTGFIVVNDLDIGGSPGQFRQQSKTFPARAVSDPITS